MYQPFEFEGEPTPPAADLLGQLNTTEARRGWLIRAAVVNAALAEEVMGDQNDIPDGLS